MSEPKPNDNPTFSSFIDWCQNKDSLSKEAKHTVEALLNVAGTSDCYEADRILSSSTELIIYGLEPIRDIRPLSTLTNLTELYISNNQISDLSPLSSLTNLTYLTLYGDQISDFSPLSTLTNLTFLLLHNNRISDLSSLSTLTNLTKLTIYCTANSDPISNIRPLSSLTNLTQLSISNNQISDLSPLSNLTNLTKLYLNGNQISDLSPLSTLTNLTELHLCHNKISDIRPLLTLAKLLELDLYLNPICDLSILRSHEDKWHTLCQKPIDRQKAKEAIKSAYGAIGKAEPEILFCSSPYAGILILQVCESLGESLAEQLSQLTSKPLNPVMWNCLLCLTVFQPGEATHQLNLQIYQELKPQFYDDGFHVGYCITLEDRLRAIALTEYCVSKLGCVLDPETQEAFHCLNQLFEHCGWIWAYENVCIVCDRPTHLLFDNEYRLHAEGQPAIQFSDGYSLYSYHGVTLPEKYGKIHPNNWQAEWILSEQNAELRRVLIQGIGYTRICQELAAQELDNWREYTLLKIDNDVDVEPVYLLKMTCPSTGHIHALRVPPDMQTAREAIRWVNWDIDPEEFSVET